MEVSNSSRSRNLFILFAPKLLLSQFHALFAALRPGGDAGPQFHSLHIRWSDLEAKVRKSSVMNLNIARVKLPSFSILMGEVRKALA